ncbi:MAG: hypothetical protein KAI73_09190, partial [Rhodospirillaceae bacterium]|nr:hypothetical protein [Rhodospirillaceae bacterium]
MYNLLRNFTLISLAAVAIATVGLFWSMRTIMTDQIITETELRNIQLSASFANSLGKDIAKFMVATQDHTPAQLKSLSG